MPTEQRGFFSGVQVRSSNHLEEEAMLRRARFCINHYQDRFRSPDGRRLNIVLNSNEPEYRVPRSYRRNVELMTTEHSSNRDQWENGINCSVIIHEIFHHLGLPDGYPPNSLTNNDLHEFRSDSGAHLGCSHHSLSRLNCRHIEPSGIMNDYNALLSGPNSRFVEGIHCSPQNYSFGPRQIVRGNLPDSCPDGYYIEGRTRQRMAYSILNGWQSRRRDGSILYIEETRVSGTQGVLGNAHIRHIINPNCVSQNRSYLTCIQNAGRRSNCLPTPDYCRGDFIN